MTTERKKREKVDLADYQFYKNGKKDINQFKDVLKKLGQDLELLFALYKEILTNKAKFIVMIVSTKNYPTLIPYTEKVESFSKSLVKHYPELEDKKVIRFYRRDVDNLITQFEKKKIMNLFNYLKANIGRQKKTLKEKEDIKAARKEAGELVGPPATPVHAEKILVDFFITQTAKDGILSDLKDSIKTFLNTGDALRGAILNLFYIYKYRNLKSRLTLPKTYFKKVSAEDRKAAKDQGVEVEAVEKTFNTQSNGKLSVTGTNALPGFAKAFLGNKVAANKFVLAINEKDVTKKEK